MPETAPKVYEGRVAEENGELVVVFDPTMLEELGWGEGDTIVWEIRDDGIVIRRANDQLDL